MEKSENVKKKLMDEDKLKMVAMEGWSEKEPQNGMAAVDTTGDSMADVVILDTDDNGTPDTIVADTNNDGYYDTIIPYNEEKK